MINIIFFVLMIPLVLLFTKNVIGLLYQMNDMSSHKRRLEQIRLTMKKREKDNYETMENMTEGLRVKLFPLIQDYLPSLKLDNREQLALDIKTAGWDDTFSPDSFIATGLFLKSVGILFSIIGFSIFPGPIKLYAGVIGIVLFFGLDYWFRGEVNAARTNLFKDFPDFIRIVSGYLSADMNLLQAISSSIKYVGDGWKPILQQLVIDCKTKGADYGFNQLKENVDIFEVKEFVALVRLTLEMGGNVRDGFEQQADKISEIQKNILIAKIGQRKTWTLIIQGPLLLCNLVAIGLPTFGQVAEFLTQM